MNLATSASTPEVAVLAAATLESLASAVAVLDATGASLMANRAARVIFDSDDGLSYGPRGLRAHSPTDDARLRDLIRNATSAKSARIGTSGLARISRPSLRHAFVVTVSPLGQLSHDTLLSRPQVLVSIRDPERDVTTAPEVLRQLWGLTFTEARVCSELVRGVNIARIAALLGIETDTVRKHVKEIFGKTGTNRQAALISLVLSSLVGMRPGAE